MRQDKHKIKVIDREEMGKKRPQVENTITITDYFQRKELGENPRKYSLALNSVKSKFRGPQ